MGRELSGNEPLNDDSLGNVTGINIADADGRALGAEHKQDNLLGGCSKLSVVYGQCTTSSAGARASEKADAIALPSRWMT